MIGTSMHETMTGAIDGVARMQPHLQQGGLPGYPGRPAPGAQQGQAHLAARIEVGVEAHAPAAGGQELHLLEPHAGCSSSPSGRWGDALICIQAPRVHSRGYLRFIF